MVDMTTPRTCTPHGIRADQCSICAPRPGGCDYGTCRRKAITTVPVTRDNGTVAENRPLCAKHAPRFVAMLAGARS